MENKEFFNSEVKEKREQSLRFKAIIFVFLFVGISFGFYQFFLEPFFLQTKRQENPIEEKNQIDVLEDVTGVTAGDLALDFTSEDVYGNKISLSDFRNKKSVLLIFWATWCSFCAKELPDLKDFAEEHQNEIQVIAVDSGEPKETIKNYIQEENINFLMLLDEDRKIWNRYLVRGTPSHFLIGKDGKIVSLRPGLVSLQDLEVMLTMLK